MTHAGLTRDLEDRIANLEALVKSLQDALDRATDAAEDFELEHRTAHENLHRRQFDRWDGLANRISDLEIRVRRAE